MQHRFHLNRVSTFKVHGLKCIGKADHKIKTPIVKKIHEMQDETFQERRI